MASGQQGPGQEERRRVPALTQLRGRHHREIERTIQKAFALLDVEQKGCLPRESLREGLAMTGCEPSRADKVMQLAATTAPPLIDFEEFRQIVVAELSTRSVETEVDRALELLRSVRPTTTSTTSTGEQVLQWQHLAALREELGISPQQLRDHDLQQMISEFASTTQRIASPATDEQLS
ncbi:hypothetical protein QOT17_002117 [Balamuthia mandrillaris]